ncbi:RNA polymerase sigma factor [Eisenibacter elegans]|jgi:RNA polymerase sigma factor (sigma-70 family)|uniref:RNA polymerase sigma factor n=1 Tax=Eisenibacter elegans TaxID=997 RepID=UPI00047D3AD4|nr:sigma-70 family RNA polymerase sigma factor [Eisenibacter elegans]
MSKLSAPTYTETDLIEAIRQGDNKALAYVYKTHYKVIANLIFQNNGTEQEAQDVYQEAVIVLYENLQDAQFALNCQIKTYLYAVSRRLWLKRLRQKSRFLPPIQDLEEFVPLSTQDEGRIDEREAHFNLMAQALEQLGEPCASVLKQYYVAQMSMQEIADTMGYNNTDSAKNQKYKCLMRLKKLFFDNYKPE